MRPGNLDSKCTTYEKGAFAKCIHIYFSLNCPKPIDDKECKKLFDYNKCHYQTWLEYNKRENLKHKHNL